MSLILDALNRADKERSEQALTPSLHPSAMTPDQSISVGRWLLIALVCGAIVGIAVYLLLANSAAKPSQTSPSRVPEPAPIALNNSTPEPIPVQQTAIEPAPVAATQSPSQTASSSPAGGEEDQHSIAKLYQQKSSAKRTTAAAGPTAEARPAAPLDSPPVARKKRKTGQDILREIPFLSSLPPRFQQTVPNIEYSVHVYNEEDGSGMVNLNGVMRRVGSELAPGLRVIAILPDSVVLDYRGTQFRLYALNSWMNF